MPYRSFSFYENVLRWNPARLKVLVIHLL
jgi:hypothetical protein